MSEEYVFTARKFWDVFRSVHCDGMDVTMKGVAFGVDQFKSPANGWVDVLPVDTEGHPEYGSKPRRLHGVITWEVMRSAVLVTPEKTMAAPLPTTTGTIIFTREYGTDGIDQVSAEWEGGDVVAFSKEFIENASPRWFHRIGTGIQACQFRLEVISETSGIVYARRIS